MATDIPTGGDARIRVLVLDDHRIVIDGVRLILDGQPDMRVVGEARSLHAAQALAIHPDPDVILAGLAPGLADGADMVTALQATFPASAVVVLSVVDDWAAVRSVLSAGARGYVPKTAPGSDLVDAVRRVARGEDYLHHSVGVALARSEGPPVYLSDREMSVGRLLALGHTNAEIADLLIVSVRTVETHRAHLLRKLGVHSRAELVRVAVRMGLVDLSLL